MSDIAADDFFLGSWELQPELSSYEHGNPPAEGLYRISVEGDSYLFDIAWKTVGGQQFETSFSGTADGRQYPYENTQIIDKVSFTRVDELRLDSESFKDGVRIAHARRELLENGRVMRVTESGQTPDSVTFSNVSHYHKLD